MRRGTAVACLALLAGCGGGGGGGGGAPVPLTAALSVSSPTAFSGDAVTLTWVSTGASGCEASGAWQGPLATGGNRIVTADGTGDRTYTVTCSRGGESASASAQLSVKAAPPVVRVSISQSQVGPGVESTVAWTATNADSCVAEGSWSGSMGLQGSQAVSQPAPGVYPYTIACTNAAGTARDSALLGVTALADMAGVPQFARIFGDFGDPMAGIPFTAQIWGRYIKPDTDLGAVRAEIQRWKAAGKLYFTSTTIYGYFGTPRDDWDAFRMRTIDGGYGAYTDGSNRVYSLSAPEFRDFIKSQARLSVDAGADGIHVDDIGGPFASIVYLPASQAPSFDTVTMAAFRQYLSGKYTAGELQSRFGISDISSFDLASYLVNRGLASTWNATPLIPIVEEFFLFRRQEVLDFLQDLATTTKAYALQTYGRPFALSFNSANDSMGNLVKSALEVPGLETFYIRGKDRPFKAVDVKQVNGWRPGGYWLPEAFPARIGATNPLDKPTRNLEKVIIADLQASGGIAGATLQMNEGLNEPQPVDLGVVRRYAKFIRGIPEFSSNLQTHAKVAVLSSEASILGGVLAAPAEPRPWEGRSGYFGMGRLLLDAGINYDSVDVPSATYSLDAPLGAGRLAPYDVVIAPSVWALSDADVDVLLAFARQGGTLVIDGAFASSNTDRSAASRPAVADLLTHTGFVAIGAGRAFISTARWGSRYDNAADSARPAIRADLQQALAGVLAPAVKLTQPVASIHDPGVVPYLYRNAGNTIVHLVNYDYDDGTDAFVAKTNLGVEVDVGAQPVDEVILRSPDAAGATSLPFTRYGNKVVVQVPQLEAWAVLVLQPDAASPLLGQRAPATAPDAAGGQTLAFSAPATDADANPLSFQWRVNGVLDTETFGPDFSFTLPRDASGATTVSATATDGAHAAGTQWTFTAYPYVKPRVLFDETHAERNTVDDTKAAQIRPGHPEWVSYSTLATQLADSFAISRLTSGSLTAAVLAGTDVLVLAAPDTALTAAERTDIAAFVANGGGLILLADSSWTNTFGTMPASWGLAFDGSAYLASADDPNCPGCFALATFAQHAALPVVPGFTLNNGGRLQLSGPAVALGSTSAQAWMSYSGSPAQQPGDPSGPFTVVAATDTGTGRVWACSDNAFHNDYLQYHAENGALFAAGLQWISEFVNRH